MSDGFLGRWSKRKLDVKEGKPVEAEPILPAMPPPQPSPRGGGGEEVVVTTSSPGGEGGGEGSPVEKPPLTLEDVKALTSDSDFSRFAASDVAPEVKNAALKKLFADPRYNVMDRMDVYIDDYSQPDPIPHAMLRQLVSAKFLGLFDQEEKEEAEAAARQARDVADNPIGQTVAQSEPPPTAVPEVPEPTDHADPDLRLQQDHAAAGEDPGRGTE
jgi:hypothetical protein